MTDLKDTIANIRKARYEGTDKASAFVSGDVTSGKVRGINQEVRDDDDSESESAERHEDNHDT